MNPNYKHTLLGFEIAQTIEYMIKYYNRGIQLCKSDKRRNIFLKELARIKQIHKDLVSIDNYKTIVFDISDCDNKAKNLINSRLLHDQMNKQHEIRRSKRNGINNNQKH